MTLALVMAFSSFNFGNASAEASTKPVDSDFLTEETINVVDEFIVFENNKFEIKDVNVLVRKIGGKEFSKVKKEVKEKNILLSEISEEEFKNTAEVVGNHIEFSDQNGEEPGFSVMTYRGKNTLQVLWWGYRVYLNDNLTKTTAQALAGGAGTATLVGIWSPWFSAPTAVIKAVAASAAVVLGGSSAMMFNTNKGSGIYLRFTGILPMSVVYTGMFSQ